MAWHVSAVRLPDGLELEDSWLTASGWTSQPVREADSLPGRFALPGFVDCHSHVSFAAGKDGPLPLDSAGARANLAQYAKDGVGMVRDAGGVPNVVLNLPRLEGHPFLIAAGRHLAPVGRYFEAVHQPVEPEDLVSVALSEIKSGARWVKLVGDFQSAESRAAGTFVVEPTYDLNLVRELIRATHVAGARLAAHVTTELVGDLVRAGIDSVEHGPGLDKDTVGEMASRGTAWTPTLCAVLSAGPDVPEERRKRAAERRERMRELLPLAIRLGVPVLTGSDVVGSIPREIALFIQLGVDPTDALRAATTAAVRYLGMDAGNAPASVVTFDADPRQDPEVVSTPRAVVIGGVRVR